MARMRNVFAPQRKRFSVCATAEGFLKCYKLPPNFPNEWRQIRRISDNYQLIPTQPDTP